MPKKRPNPLFTIEGLQAARGRRKLRAWESRRLTSMLRFEREQANKAYARRVKYALGRSKPLPEPTNKTQERLRDSEVIHKGTLPRRTKYQSGRDKLRRKHDVHNHEYGIHRVYSVPFKYGKSGLELSQEAIRAIFATEHLRTLKGKPVNLRAFAHVKFKDQIARYKNNPKDKGERWLCVESGGYPTLADTLNVGADGMYEMITLTLERYELARVLGVEIQATQI